MSAADLGTADHETDPARDHGAPARSAGSADRPADPVRGAGGHPAPVCSAGYRPDPTTDPARRHGTGPMPPPIEPAALEQGVASRFAECVRRYPDRPAVLAADRVLTYRQLAGAAGATAAGLRSAGVRRGDRVGVLTGHGAGTVAAILGVLAAGGCYVPIDPDYPAERVAAMRAAADAAVLLTDAAHRAAAGPGRVLVIDDLPAAPWPDDPPAGPDDPAYLLFTSGSTGRPKAVLQNQRNVLYGALGHARNLRAGPDDRMSVVSSFSFDMAVTDMFSALLTGAAVVPVDVRVVGPAGLAAVLREQRVSVYHSTPTLFRHLTDTLGASGRLPALRVVLLGGEEVLRDDVRRCRRHCAPDCVFVNGYGATEVSFAVQHHIPAHAPLPDGVLPIGTPLPGMRVWLRGADGRPADTTGEIVVTGRHVALGYRPDDVPGAQRFTDHGDGSRSYRTGDLARRLPDGTLCCLGRVDRQVKIRGYRVEPGEVEAALVELPEVARAVVVADRTGGAEPRLVGYLLAAPAAAVDTAAVRAALADRLPHYLVPSMLLVLDRLPLTATGKVDTAALPAPSPPVDPAPAPTPGAAPSGGDAPIGTEATVAAAWCAVLGVDSVGPRQHFFDLGGHSLLLARVQQRLQDELHRPIPLARLFEHPTVRSFASYLDGTAGVGQRTTSIPGQATARHDERAGGRHTTDVAAVAAVGAAESAPAGPSALGPGAVGTGGGGHDTAGSGMDAAAAAARERAARRRATRRRPAEGSRR